MNILLSDFNSYKSIVLAKSLKKFYKEINVFALVEKKKAYSSKYFTGTIILEDLHDIAKLNSILNQYNINYFVPVKGEYLSFLLKNKNKFEKVLDYWGAFDSFDLLNDKLRLHNLALKTGILVPHSFSSVEKLKLPCVMKPISLSAARSVRYIRTNTDLEKAKEVYSGKEYILQEYIEGTGVGYSVFCRDGKIIVGYGHKRLAEYPISGGSSVYRTCYEDTRMHDVAELIIKETNWSGFAMFEFKLTKDNRLFLIEVNPRIWGSINQGLQYGLNYFEPLLGSRSHKEIHHDINTYLSPLIYSSLIKYMLKLNFNPLVKFFKYIRKNKADISMIDDPAGWLSMVFRKF